MPDPIVPSPKNAMVFNCSPLNPASHRADRHKRIRGRRDAKRIPQRPSEAVEPHLHHIAICQPDAFAETERVGAEEVNVHVAGPAVRFELEVMVLHIGQAVAHRRFAGLNRLSTRACSPAALDRHLAGHAVEVRVRRPVPDPIAQVRSFEDAR